jgi:hypothetical protein
MSAVPAKAPAYKRVRRQKQFVAVGSVALLAVLGFQLPKLLGGGGQAAPAVTTTALPNLLGSPPIAAVGRLPNTDRVVIQRDSNQLLSFGLFKSKDPFIQQLSTNASTPVASPAATKPTPKPKSKPSLAPSSPIGVGLTPLQTTTTTAVTSTGVSNPPSSPGAAVTTSGSPGTTPATTTPGAPATAPTDVLISTNGVCERIAVKGTFPANEDIFRVLSIAPGGKSVEVGVVGGSYDSGQATAKLKLGEKLTLVNTADGTRYVIKLESRCNVVTPPASATSTAPLAPATPTTTATPTPTTTTTSPIVTDSLDTSFPTN